VIGTVVYNENVNNIKSCLLSLSVSIWVLAN